MRYQIRNAKVQFGADTILNSVNFEIHDTEKIAIVGRNGCGKTTLLRLIAEMCIRDRGEQKTAGGLDFCNVVDRAVLLVDVFFQQIRETDDGIHRGSDVVAHVEQKTCFCFVGRLRFLYGFFQFCCVNLVFIAAHLELQKTNRGKQGKDESECKENKNLQRTEPAVFRYNFKMPGVVRHGAENFDGIGTPGIAGVCDGNVFAGGRRNFPEFVGVAGFFQCKMCIRDR